MENWSSTLENYLENVTSIGNNVYSGDLEYQGEKMARFFIDASNKIFKDDVDIPSYLEQFQDQFIIPKYFNDSGSLQWNYYQLIIAEGIDELAKDFIEKEKSYTRKFILHPDQLELFFGYESRSNGKVVDIAGIWRSILEKDDLDCVFLPETPYTSGVDSFLSGKAVKAEKLEEEISSTGVAETGNTHLTLLKLGNGYRAFPKRREFEFGKVNLIRGANGSGKTSLIEAIEFGYCGKIQRNTKENDFDPDIVIQFSGISEIESVNISDRERYRKRDREWYGHSANAAKRRDGIQQRFNLFNFFDSDAAFRLSQDGVNFIDALLHLITGPDVTLLSERIEGFNTRFSEINRRSQREYEQLILALNEKESELINLKSKDTSATSAFTSTAEFLKQTDLTDLFPSELTGGFKVFEEWLTSVNLCIATIEKNKSGLADPTLDDALERITNIDQALQNYRNEIGEIKKLQNNLLESNSDLSTKQKRERVLTTSMKYVQEPDIVSIIGLEERLQQLNNRIKIDREIRDNFNSNNWTLLLGTKGSCKELKKSLELLIVEKREKYTSKSKQLKLLRSGFAELDNIRLEIKDLGSKYISKDPDSVECPMCHEKQGSTEALQERILRSIKNIEPSLKDDAIILDLNMLESEGKELKSKLELLDEFIKLAGLILSKSDEWLEKTIEQITSEIATKFNQIEETELLERELQKRFSNFKAKNLSEGEYEQLTSEVREFLPSVILNPESKDAVENSLVQFQNEVNLLKEEITLREKEIVDRTIATELLLDLNQFQFIPKIHLSNLQNIEEYRANLERLRTSLSELRVLFPKRNFPMVLQLTNELNELNFLYDNFQKQVTFQEESSVFIKKIENEINSSKIQITNLKTQIENSERAVKVFEKIKNEFSKEKFLEEFLNSNRKEILSIFGDIHSPREFTKIKFEDNKVSLYREIHSKWVDLLDVSTGQRAALALSIFLALNKTLKNGPRIIIFDDPITFIDDLNMLGFFDFLRKLVINEDRQIFFATAGEKIANLFEHKFDFLDKDFRTFELDRMAQ